MSTNETQPTPTDDVLKTGEAARFLKISEQTLRAMVRDGRIQPRRFGANGRLWRFVRSELLAPKQTEQSVSKPQPLAEIAGPGQGRRLQRINGALRYR